MEEPQHPPPRSVSLCTDPANPLAYARCVVVALQLRANGLVGSLSAFAEALRTQLSEEGQRSLDAAGFRGLRDLTELDLSENDLTGTIPTQLSLLSKLNTLRLTGNRHVWDPNPRRRPCTALSFNRASDQF